MLANCSICLSAYKGPVSIPCGHIYCKKCLADHVNSSSGMGEITASCPTCRSTFYIVKPDLTYLPKKYHEYVLPAVRRVYMDSTLDSSLQQKLAKSEARVAKLENEQEIVLNQCEAHMAASQAHAFGEHNALKEVERLKRQMDGLSSQMKDRDMLQNQLIEEEVTYWKTKYRRLKQRLQSIERS
ncbi:hypothetical protein F5887DRAFT_881457 [Amanita rubescens]|nr:hypothetical protein F5887DRAFT_881457 [Amanita rubescens]